MSVKSTLLTILEDIIGVGETLTPVFIHNPVSQTITTILTTDVNALLSQLASSGKLASGATTTTPAA